MNRKVWFKEEELIKGDTIMSLLLDPHQEEKKGGIGCLLVCKVKING
jgi:hypothetical protein|tara:strand:- start:274 stop:414 length:141 start_codon:yes stop_codon:yes gene_type:complete